MNKRLSQLLLFSVLSLATVSAQTLKGQFKDTSPKAQQSVTATTSKNSIKLNPASKFNCTTPDEIADFASKNANSRTYTNPMLKRSAAKTMRRIDAYANVADSLVLYGIMKQAEGSTLTSNHFYTFHAASTENFIELANGKEIPNNMAYVYAKGNYYLFSAGKVTIIDATTGETVKSDIALQIDSTDITPMQAGTYDPTTGLIYLAYWAANWTKGILSFNPDTYETAEFTNVGSKYVMGMSSAADGNLYFISYPSNLYKVDMSTKEATLISSKAKAPGKSYQNATASMSIACDWATNKLYIANLTQDWLTHVSCMDPTTGSAYTVFDFPNSERFVGLYIPIYDEDAPAAPHDISFEYSAAGSLSGQLKFTVPTTTYRNGNTLSGSLTAHIVVDGTEETMSVTAGQAVSLDKTLTQGNHVIEIYVSNAAGDGAMRRLCTFAGYDVPSAVTDLAIEVNNNNATLTWTAPTTSLNGGPVDDSTIGYKIVRYPDETVVAHELQATTFTDAMPTARMHYWYDVISESGTNEGGVATTEEVIGGTAYIPPFTETFETQSDFDNFTVIDANNDQQTWIYMASVQCAHLQGNGITNSETGFVATCNDDYLVSPNITLKKDVDYTLSMNIGDTFVPEHLSILLGKSNTLTGDEVKLDSVIFSTLGTIDHTVDFNVTEDGDYYLFFYANTVGNSGNFEFNEFSVDIKGTYAGPDSVTNTGAQAGALGALTNKVYFTAPTKTYKGETLTDLTRIEIYKGDAYLPVKTFENPGIGQFYSWDDPNVTQGQNVYKVVAYNAAGRGRTATIVNWTGIDVPQAPADITVKMDPDTYKPIFTWTGVSNVGTHGGYVDVDQVRYVVCMYNEYNWDDHWTPVSDSLTDVNFTYEDYNVGDTQQYCDFLVRACNDVGYSGNGVGITLGPPYERPYEESFAGGVINKAPWTRQALTYYYGWNVVTGEGLTVKPKDNDGGMLRFTWMNEYSSKEVLLSPRVSLKDAVSPELSFYMYHGFDAEPEDLTLDIYTNVDDAGFEKVATVAYNNDEEGWTRHSIALPTDANNVQFAIAANAIDNAASIFVDEIKIDESVSNDLSLEYMNCVKRITAGNTANISVRVSNNGTETAKNFKVSLLKDGVEEASTTVAELAQNGVEDITFDFATTIADMGKSYQLQTIVKGDGDVVVTNDSSIVRKLTVAGSTNPAATNLTGNVNNTDVWLSWTKPATSEKMDAITDDFEDYESFIIDSIGDWTTYDGDGTTPAYFNGPSIPHVYEAQAWQVWDPEKAGFSLDKFDVLEPHSGNQYLACWAASDGVSSILTNDDWLISSKVVGGSDVDFWLRVPNDGSGAQVIEMLSSNNDSLVIDNIGDDFVAFDRDSVEGTTDWVHFIYTLPADAKYFAIRCCTYETHLVLFLDDITYTPLYGSTTQLTLNGYNVYRDGELIGTTKNTTFVDENAATSQHTYLVTVNWQEGESNPSNPYVNDVVDGVDEISSLSGATVFGGKQCIRIVNAGGMPVSIFTTGGARVYSGRVADQKTVNVAEGIYLVQIGNKTTKVVVR
ncbi:MAG: CARDB domain-containing protein [Prevotella sp.]